MKNSASHELAIMRLFQVKARKNCASVLMEKFATTSADVVQNEPGNEGYLFGRGVAIDEDVVIFASFWKDLNAVKQRFGEDWQQSFLPAGYEDLIDECSLRHIDIGSGWHVRLDKSR